MDTEDVFLPSLPIRSDERVIRSSLNTGTREGRLAVLQLLGPHLSLASSLI